VSFFLVCFVALLLIALLIYFVVLLERSEARCSTQERELNELRSKESEALTKLRSEKQQAEDLVERWKEFNSSSVRELSSQLNSKSAKLEFLRADNRALLFRYNRLSIRFRRFAESSLPTGPIAGIFQSYALAIAEQAEQPRNDTH